MHANRSLAVIRCTVVLIVTGQAVLSIEMSTRVSLATALMDFLPGFVNGRGLDLGSRVSVIASKMRPHAAAGTAVAL